MSTNASDILDAALNLPDAQRASLAYRLLQSLKPPSIISDGDDGFEAELERRVAEFEAGKTVASDWNDVATRLRAVLQKRATS